MNGSHKIHWKDYNTEVVLYRVVNCSHRLHGSCGSYYGLHHSRGSHGLYCLYGSHGSHSTHGSRGSHDSQGQWRMYGGARGAVAPPPPPPGPPPLKIDGKN